MIDKRLEKIDYPLIICVVLAVVAGILTLYSQEANFSEGPGKWSKQILYALIGFTAMIFVSRVNYQLLGSYALIIYIVSIILLILTLIPGIGYLPNARGARSWLKLGPFSLQTSEFAKLATVILLGQYLVLREREVRKITVLIIPFIIVLVPMGLIAIQPDFGTAIAFLPILFAMLFLGGADILHIGSLVYLGAVSLCIPMYVEYTKLTLLDNFKDQLVKMEQTELVTLLNRIGGKVWLLLKGKTVTYKDSPVVLSDNGFQKLQEAAEQVIEDNTGLFFQFFTIVNLLLIFGIIFSLISLVLIALHLAQGKSLLRKYYIPLGMLGLSLLAIVGINKTVPFRENQVIRLTAFVNPDKFRQGAGYQLRASKPAIGSGRFLGKGYLKGEMTEGKIPHVPESSTDFIFASWAEQFGFLGSVFLVFILLAIPLRGLQISFESKDRFGSLLAAGIVALIYFHLLINIGIVLGLLPVTGLPLSFVSYGGSHLIMSMVAVGIIISIKIRKHAN
ncbi:MAG: rod shape-determining protein RodA [Leptospiraceae bacterium]|nr:rod shape-determining protein RodA [Leptospiraceae bacterium]